MSSKTTKAAPKSTEKPTDNTSPNDARSSAPLVAAVPGGSKSGGGKKELKKPMDYPGLLEEVKKRLSEMGFADMWSDEDVVECLKQNSHDLPKTVEFIISAPKPADFQVQGKKKPRNNLQKSSKRKKMRRNRKNNKQTRKEIKRSNNNLTTMLPTNPEQLIGLLVEMSPERMLSILIIRTIRHSTRMIMIMKKMNIIRLILTFPSFQLSPLNPRNPNPPLPRQVLLLLPPCLTVTKFSDTLPHKLPLSLPLHPYLPLCLPFP